MKAVLSVLVVVAVALALSGCAGKIGTMVYVPYGQQADISVGPPAAAASSTK